MPPKKSVALKIAPELAEHIRDAAFWVEGETFASIIEKGAAEYVAKLEAERGTPFPPREGEIKAGRPRKA